MKYNCENCQDKGYISHDDTPERTGGWESCFCQEKEDEESLENE